MNDAFDWARFHDVPLVGILRYSGPLDYRGFADAVLAGGLTTLEVSFTHSDAADHLSGLRAVAGNELNLGAGTVTTLERFACARQAGATFVVTPGLNPDVIAACREDGQPVFPGAFTPTEVLAASALGAALVKLFPAITLGPAFVSQLKAAVPEVRLLPTGGINAADIPRWRKAGADGVGLGGGLFPASLLAERKWSDLARHIRTYVDAWHTAPFNG